MRAILRAVLADRRKPRPTPAEKLSGFFGVLRFVVMGRDLAISAMDRSCRTVSNHPPRVDRLQESWTSRACIVAEHRIERRYDRPV
jgi:hypothetical protein